MECAGDVNNCFSGRGACVPYHVSCYEGNIQPGTEVVNIDCFTYGGQSGSPVWLYYKSSNTRIVRGVLVADNANFGRFTLITRDVFDFLQRNVNHL